MHFDISMLYFEHTITKPICYASNCHDCFCDCNHYSLPPRNSGSGQRLVPAYAGILADQVVGFGPLMIAWSDAAMALFLCSWFAFLWASDFTNPILYVLSLLAHGSYHILHIGIYSFPHYAALPVCFWSFLSRYSFTSV